jgi:hypothetical protein
MKRIRAIWRNARKPFDRLWSWAKGDHPRRWKRLVRWTTKKREQARKGHKLARARFWAAKRTVYRKKWKRAKKRLEPRWEDWMANGRSLNFNAAAKQEAAIAVVTFGCAVTSTYRATVIPQSNPNSYHGPNVSPGKAVDVAGARMGVYQQDVFSRRKGDSSLLELFGPINHLGLKNGSQVTLGEGSFLEDLHDSHVHVAAS